MIAIVNRKHIDDEPGGKHEYTLQINNRVIGTFVHRLRDGLVECLRKATICAEGFVVEEMRDFYEFQDAMSENEDKAGKNER